MKTLILGPTKTRILDDPPEVVIARLAAWADSPQCPFEASHRGGHFQFAIRRQQRRTWSPYLTLEVRDLATLGEDVIDASAPVSEGAGAIAERLGDAPPPLGARTAAGEHLESTRPPGIGTGRTEVFGRFNPSPGIWTGYMLATLSLLTLIFGALIWAWAETMLDRPPLALWAIPACVLVLVVMWGISAVGQGLARDEMHAIWTAVQQTLGLAAERGTET